MFISISDNANPTCSSTLNECVDITVNDLPSVDITGQVSICTDDCYDLLLDNFIGQAPFVLEYQVVAQSNGAVLETQSVAGLQNGDFITICPSEAAVVEVLSLSDANTPSCESLTSTGFIIDFIPLPTAALSALDGSGTVSICEGDVLELNLTLTGTGPWEVAHDFTGQASPLIVNASPFTWDLGAISSSFDVNLLSVFDQSSACTNALNEVVSVTMNPLPTAGISSDQTICAGDATSIIFNLDPAGASPYDVEWTDGTNITVSNGIFDGFEVNPVFSADGQVCLFR